MPSIFLILLEVPITVPNVTGLALVVVLLAQGCFFWLAKHRQLTRRESRLPGIGVFWRLRWVNVLALVAGLVVILAGASPSPDSASWPGIGFWVFALLEYINYFHIQIMPTPAWGGWLPRRSHLARDLTQMRFTAPSSQELRSPKSASRRERNERLKATLDDQYDSGAST